MTLDTLDRLLINRLQDGLPLAQAPFRALAEDLGTDEQDIVTRLARLREDGVITRFGPFYDAAAMGGAFCLCAMAVPEQEFDAVLTKVNALPEVAHNYERAHVLNMWFVLATEIEAGIDRACRQIEAETGLTVLAFPKLQEFFIGFRVAA
jgi:DNA-binding Lrp family transcriptional regulator